MYLFVSLLSVFILADAQRSSPGAALRIVVIEGEDAINVIQQKTAVAPVIEVRDRNNLPVSGVAVTFSVGGQGASFGGLSTLTVTTNAAGQAAAVGLTPTAAGAIQINATALVQGQALTATITQTNVLTAAQAAGAASASAGGASGTAGSGGTTAGATGGAAGGGGGISGTTLGIVGAAVGGGALAATQVGGDESTTAPVRPAPRIFRGAFASTITLTFQGCFRIETWVGTLEMAMPGDGSIDGNASITGGTTRVEAVTCTGGPQLGATATVFMPVTPITGSTANIVFTSEVSNNFLPSATDAFGGVNITGFQFSGALNGAEITGTLTHTRRIVSANPDARVPGTGSASVAITLRQ
jgi:hypothetical protein